MFFDISSKAFISGFVMQIGLITSLGMQNLYLIDRGIKKEYPFIAAIVCFICEFILIGFGLLGAAQLSVALQQLLTVIAALFLVAYGLRAVYKAAFSSSSDLSLAKATPSATTVILAAIGFSLLNPQAIVESLVFYGGLSQRFSDSLNNFVFGALAASFLWLMSLASVTTFAIPNPPSQRAMRWLNAASGFILIAMGLGLGLT